MTLVRYHSAEMRRFFATPLPVLQELTLVVNLEKTTRGPMAQFQVSSEKYPSLTKLSLDGVAITNKTRLPHLRHLDLRNYPMDAGSEPLHWPAFAALLNSAPALAILTLDRYLRNTQAFEGHPGLESSRVRLRNLVQVHIRDVPNIAQTFVAWLEHCPTLIRITGLMGIASLERSMFRDLLPGSEHHSVTRSLMSATHASLVFTRNGLEVGCEGPKSPSKVVLGIDHVLFNQLHEGSTMMVLPAVCDLLSREHIITLDIVDVHHCRISERCWGQFFANLRNLHVLTYRGSDDVASSHAWVLIDGLLKMRYAPPNDPLYNSYPRGLRTIMMYMTDYSQGLLELFEEFVTARDPQGHPVRWIERLELHLIRTILHGGGRPMAVNTRETVAAWTARLGPYVKTLEMTAA